MCEEKRLHGKQREERPYADHRKRALDDAHLPPPAFAHGGKARKQRAARRRAKRWQKKRKDIFAPKQRRSERHEESERENLRQEHRNPRH